MTARATAAAQFALRPALVAELDATRCTNTYGVAPCAAAGGVGHECYYTRNTCQDVPNFAAGIRTESFCSAHLVPPAGTAMRPYLVGDGDPLPTEAQLGKGLAKRGSRTLEFRDEPCPDFMDDPHYATRPVPAGGTWWGRFLARNKYLYGRFIRLRDGYVTEPFDWSTFQTELYIVTGVTGPDERLRVRMTVKDPVALLDTAKAPAPTTGKLAAALPAVAFVGLAVSATSNTLVLPAEASAIDGAYVGMEVWIYADTGAGQRRTVSAYVGATRTATLSTAWAVIPDATSSLEIGALSMTLVAGSGAQYADPAVTGQVECVRVGKEVVRYTARTGDVLSWSDTTMRAQFGSTREDHKQGDVAQACLVFIDATPFAVLQRLINLGGLADTYLDLAGIAEECDTWLSGLLITDCLSAPEQVSALVNDLLIDLDAVMWWHAPTLAVKMLANKPRIASSLGTLTDDDVVLGSVQVQPLDAERITSQLLWYGLRDATEDRKRSANYTRGAGNIDVAARSPEEWGDDRPAVRMSHWLQDENEDYADAWAARQVARLRDIPLRISFKVAARSEQAVGALVNLSLRAIVGVDGLPLTTLVRVVRTEWKDGVQDVVAQTTAFNMRYGFIAPDTAPDYAVATEADRAYAYLCGDDGLMANGDAGYSII